MSSPEVMLEINKIEENYGVDLAPVIMKIMVGDMPVKDLAEYFVFANGLEQIKSEGLVAVIMRNVLIGVSNFLNIKINDSVPPSPPAGIDTMEKKNTSQPPSANFYFSPEDEEEVKKLAEKIPANEPMAHLDMDETIEKIIRSTGMDFVSSFMDERFRQILKTYLRGVRKKIDTIQTLLRPYESGGLGLDQTTVDKIMAAAGTIEPSDSTSQKVKEAVIEQPIIPSPAPVTNDNYFDNIETAKAADKPVEKFDIMASVKNIGVRDFEYDLAKEIQLKKETEAKQQAQEADEIKPDITGSEEFIEDLDIEHELMPPTPSIIKPVKNIAPAPAVQSSPKIDPPIYIETKDENGAELKILSIKPQLIKTDKPIETEPEKETSVKIEKEPAAKIEFIRPVNLDGKVKMEDVKYVPLVLDPIDELRYFNLINFRRLSPNAKEAADKIKEKIELLKNDKFSRGIEGIKAWRESSVSKIYVQMGHECFERAIDITEVIKQREVNGEECLTVDEFNAIMDLNKSLRF